MPPTAAVDLTALASLEASRQAALCQLLEHSMGNWCDDYLRQLATTAVRVRVVSEIAAMQAELLKHREPPAEAQPVATETRKTASGTAKRETKPTLPVSWWGSTLKSSSP